MAGKHYLTCGAWGCLPFDAGEDECICPSSRPCMWSMPWSAVNGPGCPYNQTSRRCDYDAAGVWFMEHGDAEHPELLWVHCESEVQYPYTYCPVGNKVKEISAHCREITTTTTSPPCTPESVPESGLKIGRDSHCNSFTDQPPFTEISGACRGVSSSDYCESYYEVLERVQDLSMCTQRCAENSSCSGISFGSGRCELWTREIGAVADDATDFRCLRKNDCELMPSGHSEPAGCGIFLGATQSVACDLTCPPKYALQCKSLRYETSCKSLAGSAWVIKQSGCGGSRCHETWADCCTCELADFLFEPVDGGIDRACRGASAWDNMAAYYALHEGVQELDECKRLCFQESTCQGIEFSPGRCEVWTRKQGIEASKKIEDKGFVCLSYASSMEACQDSEQIGTAGSPAEVSHYHCLEGISTTTPTTTTTRTAPARVEMTFDPVDGGEGRACRGASAGDNSPKHYVVVAGVFSLDACKSKCIANAKCTSIEYSTGRCEVWSRQSGAGASKALHGFACQRFASTVPVGFVCVRWDRYLAAGESYDGSAATRDVYECLDYKPE